MQIVRMDRTYVLCVYILANSAQCSPNPAHNHQKILPHPHPRECDNGYALPLLTSTIPSRAAEAGLLSDVRVYGVPMDVPTP